MGKELRRCRSLPCSRDNARKAARPAHRPVHGRARCFVAHRVRRALIQHHHDVAAKRQLDVDGRCGREHVRVAVQVRLEQHAFVADLAQIAEAEDLESAGIGQDGPRPRT